MLKLSKYLFLSIYLTVFLLTYIADLSLNTLGSICYAGERELVSCESVPGFPNTISYIKVHMDTIKPLRNAQGDNCIGYMKEVHTLNTDEPDKHMATLVYVQVNFSTNMARANIGKLVNYFTKEVSYPNTSYGWSEISPQSKELDYIVSNYERYLSQGTIGDSFRSFDEDLTNE